mgnify:CR=1 FL=1
MIRLISKKFGVAKVKILDLRTLLYKWIPPPRGGGSILKSPDLSDFEGRIPRLKEKRWENKKFPYKSPPQAGNFWDLRYKIVKNPFKNRYFPPYVRPRIVKISACGGQSQHYHIANRIL